jgi:hypothetical protein
MTTDQPQAQAQQQPPQTVTIDAADILRVLQESHPDAVRYGIWRVRAERAEALLAQHQQATDA